MFSTNQNNVNNNISNKSSTYDCLRKLQGLTSPGLTSPGCARNEKTCPMDDCSVAMILVLSQDLYPLSPAVMAIY